MMFELSSFLPFLVTAIVIVLIPGPGQALVITQIISNGKQHGFFTSLGLNTGTCFHALLMAVGLSTIIATSVLAYEVVKVCGALYLIYLGLASFKHKAHSTQIPPGAILSLRQAYFRGLLTGSLNPKVALFFIAFLPQFVNPHHGSIELQFMALGTTIAALGFSWNLILILLFGSLREKLLKSDFLK